MSRHRPPHDERPKNPAARRIRGLMGQPLGLERKLLHRRRATPTSRASWRLWSSSLASPERCAQRTQQASTLRGSNPRLDRPCNSNEGFCTTHSPVRCASGVGGLHAHSLRVGCTPPHASRNPLRCTLSDKGNLGMALSAHSGARVGGFAPIGQPQSSAVAKTFV